MHNEPLQSEKRAIKDTCSVKSMSSNLLLSHAIPLNEIVNETSEGKKSNESLKRLDSKAEPAKTIHCNTHCKSDLAMTSPRTSTNPPRGTFHIAMSAVLRIWDITERFTHRTLPNRAIAALPSYGTLARPGGTAVSVSRAFIRTLAQTDG